jgi:hypothetical protein
MLNLYAVKVWHSTAPRQFETIEIRTYSAKRAEHLARESFPGCLAAAAPDAGAPVTATLPGVAADWPAAMLHRPA